ncbi:MAG: dockerin type I repeat-containing protein [Ruminococcus sp.]|nr:dockerin type I repeat-containing protein [Ruminococcus sp.]
MLNRKAKLSLVTAFATAISALTPLSVTATPIQTPVKSDISVIPENYTRVYANTPEEPLQTATTISGDFQLAYTEPEESTIHNRLYPVTTAGKQGETPSNFPIKEKKDVTVNVVDSETGEPIEGVQVRFVETETPTSNMIKRNFGIFTTSETGELILPDLDYTLEDTSSMFLLTAVIEHLPLEYTYRGNETMIIDHIVDTGDWHARGEEVYHSTETLTISLDRAYEKHFNVSCSIIDSTNGKQVEGAHMVFSGPLNCRESWYTSGNDPYVIEDVRCLLYKNNPEAFYNLETYSLPEGYVFDYSRESNEHLKITPDFTGNAELVVYVVPQNMAQPIKTTGPHMTQPVKTTGPYLPSMNTATTTTTAFTDYTTTTQTTAVEYRNCDSCGKEIKVSDGIMTPLGMFVCKDCRASGIGGTRPVFPDKTETVTQTSVNGETTRPVTTSVTTAKDGLYHGKFQAMCFAIDATTGEKISGAELQLFDENGHIIESWDSSEKCGHQIDIDYTMDSADSYKTYQLSMLKLPEGYKFAGIADQTAEGLLSDYRKIDYGFKGVATFAVYVIPENYVFDETGVKPWQTTRTLPQTTATTASNGMQLTFAATTLAIGKIDLDSVPEKVNYTTGEKLDLTGLGVSMRHELGVNGKDGVNVIFDNVNPADYPEAFIVNTHDFDSTKAGTYTIKVKCTDDYKSDYMVTNNLLTFEVTVSEKETFSEKMGDTDGNGDVGINDAVLIMQYIANPDKYKMSAQGKLNADVYNRGDGITNMDALTIQMVECKTITLSDLPVPKQ